MDKYSRYFAFYAMSLYKYNLIYGNYKQAAQFILLRFLQKSAFFETFGAKLQASFVDISIYGCYIIYIIKQKT